MDQIPRVIPAPVLAQISDSGPSIASLTRPTPRNPDPENAHLHDLIAHYLSTSYPAALPAFLSASGAVDPATVPPPKPDLRTLVADAASAARAAALAEQMKTLGVEDEVSLDKLLARPLEAGDELKEVVKSTPVAASNLLSVTVANVPFRRFETGTAEYVAGYRRCVLVSAADKEVRVVECESGEVTALLSHKAPVLCLAIHPTQPRYLATGSMDGTTRLIDLVSGDVLQEFKAAKFVVRVAFSSDGKYLAVASYDHSVRVYEATNTNIEEVEVIDDTDDAALAADPGMRYELLHTAKTEANPEALLFHPRTEWLLYTVRASHELHYLRLPTPAAASVAQDTETWKVVTKSFNPHPLDVHVSFAVLDLALHPSGRALACITGDHAGTAGERVLVYGVEPDETTRLACIWTGADTDPFVLPRVAWLPSGRGLVTSSATGHLALLGTTGEMRSRIQVHAAQGPGTSDVVRDMVVVATEDGEGWEVVSVGYDRCVRVTRGRP